MDANLKKCPHCGAIIDTSQAKGLKCPYCGGSIVEETPKIVRDRSMRFDQILPFDLSQNDALKNLASELVTNDFCPLDVGKGLDSVKFSKVYVPFVSLRGIFSVKWGYKKINRRKIKTGPNAEDYTYEHDETPFNGTSQGGFLFYKPANDLCDIIDPITGVYLSAKEYNTSLIDGDAVVLPRDIDIEDLKENNGQYIDEFARNKAEEAYPAQPEWYINEVSYEDHHYEIEYWNYSDILFILLPFWKITYNYDGEEFESYIGGNSQIKDTSDVDITHPDSDEVDYDEYGIDYSGVHLDENKSIYQKFFSDIKKPFSRSCSLWCFDILMFLVIMAEFITMLLTLSNTSIVTILLIILVQAILLSLTAVRITEQETFESLCENRMANAQKSRIVQRIKSLPDNKIFKKLKDVDDSFDDKDKVDEYNSRVSTNRFLRALRVILLIALTALAFYLMLGPKDGSLFNKSYNQVERQQIIESVNLSTSDIFNKNKSGHLNQDLDKLLEEKGFTSNGSNTYYYHDSIDNNKAIITIEFNSYTYTPDMYSVVKRKNENEKIHSVRISFENEELYNEFKSKFEAQLQKDEFIRPTELFEYDNHMTMSNFSLVKIGKHKTKTIDYLARKFANWFGVDFKDKEILCVGFCEI